MRYAWPVTHMVMRIAFNFWPENMKENNSLDHLSVVWRIAFKWIVKK